MGEKQVFQPLTKEDKITVVLYRVGIVLSTIMMSLLAYFVAALFPSGISRIGAQLTSSPISSTFPSA